MFIEILVGRRIKVVIRKWWHWWLEELKEERMQIYKLRFSKSYKPKHEAIIVAESTLPELPAPHTTPKLQFNTSSFRTARYYRIR